ncbi:GntR family transcriptional regulator [Ramlibacter sp. PS3R-8]|uniref:GntR family transcriptional regulator n=1 Tax=Ramlibacter sp. PS3R-8 TaxID=3133437 RepID=UPI00309B1664
MSEPERSPRERAYVDIKAALLRGDFAASRMLSLRELSDRFDCPIAAVRDAVIRLECDRLLRVHPQRGIQVMEVDLDFVREAYQLRLMIELEGMRRFIEDPDLAALEGLERETRACLDALATNPDAEAIERAAQADWALHQLIVGALRSKLMSDIYRQNRERQRLIGRAYDFRPAQYASAALSEHMEFLAALKARDRERSARLLEDHITSAMRRQIGV